MKRVITLEPDHAYDRRYVSSSCFEEDSSFLIDEHLVEYMNRNGYTKIRLSRKKGTFEILNVVGALTSTSIFQLDNSLDESCNLESASTIVACVDTLKQVLDIKDLKQLIGFSLSFE